MEFNATFFVSVISFVAFTLIMNAIFYKPLTEIIEEREDFIRGAISDAENSENIASELLKNKEDSLQKTAEETRKIITSATNDANLKSQELANEAKRQAQLRVEDAKTNLQTEMESSQAELKAKVKELAETIASKVLKEETHIENINHELIDRILV